MRRVSTILLPALLAITLAGCGASSSDTKDSDSPTPSSTSGKTLVEQRMEDALREKLEQAARERAASN